MSAVQEPTATTTAPPAEVVVDQVMTDSTPAAQETAPVVSEPVVPATTATTTTEATKPEETVAAPTATEDKVEEPAVPATEAKIAEPIIEGQLGYKAPGLLKYVLSKSTSIRHPLTTSQAVHFLQEGVLAQRCRRHPSEPWSLPAWREVRGLPPRDRLG